MSRTVKILSGILVVSLLVVALAAVALAQDPQPGETPQAPRGWGMRGGMLGGLLKGLGEDSPVAPLAEKLGLTEEELLAELQAGKTIAELAEAKGVSLDSLVDLALDALRPSIESRFKSPFTFRGGPMMSRGGAMMRGFGGTSLVAVAAEELGLTEQELQAELQAGKTIADVTAEKGVALETLVDAALAAHAEQLDQAVTAGRLTQEQADLMLANMRQMIEQRLQSDTVCAPGTNMGNFGKFNRGMMRGGRGGGFAPQGAPTPTTPTLFPSA